MTPDDWGKTLRNTLRFSVWWAAAIVAGAVGLHLAIEMPPRIKIDALRTPDVIRVGEPLPFRLVGVQRPSCGGRPARALVYDDGAMVPLTDVALPNLAIIKMGSGTVDQNALSREFSAHFEIPVPRSYVKPGRAYLDLQAQDEPCGWLRGLLPANITHAKGNWMTIQPAQKSEKE